LAVFCDTDTAELPTMQASNICFTSLGLVILDEIRLPNQAPDSFFCPEPIRNSSSCSGDLVNAKHLQL
jgi:hypothetical protein